MPAWSYYATTQQPTAVLHAVGPVRFTSAEATELVVAWATRLEVFRIKADGPLEVACKLPVYGRIALLRAIRPTGFDREMLLLCTERWQVLILRYCADAGGIEVVATGNVNHPAGRLLDQQWGLCAIDPDGGVAVIHTHHKLLSVVSLEGLADAAGDPLRLRVRSVAIEVQQVKDLAFLATRAGKSSSSSQGASCDPKEAAFFVLQHDDQGPSLSVWSAGPEPCCSAAPGAAGRQPVASGVGRLVALASPLDGVLVLGGRVVAFHDHTGLRRAMVHGGPSSVTAVAPSPMSATRWLIGGADSSLWHVDLHMNCEDATSVRKAPALELLLLGTMTSPPTTLAWLSPSRAFLGSAHADSQVLRFHDPPASDGSRVTVEDTWTNLGPISDFCVVDVDGSGRHQVATCSGVGAGGSLRLVRVGVGVEEIASAEGFGGVTGMWAVRADVAAGISAILVLSFFACTRVLCLTADGAELVDEELPGLVTDEETVLCCESSGCLLQVLHKRVLAARATLSGPPCHWSAPSGIRVCAAAPVPNGVLVGTSAGEVIFLRVDTEPAGLCLLPAATWRMGAEVACLGFAAGLCAAGLWKPGLRVFRAEGDEGAAPPQEVALETLPRSAAFCRLGPMLHLMVGMGNGWLMSFTVEEASGTLSQHRSLCIGSEPVRLLPFPSHQHTGDQIFVTGNRPTILHSDLRGQLVLRVNLRHVSHVARFDLPALAGCLALVTGGRLVIGAVEDLSRVHVRTLRLGESPDKVCWHQGAGTFVVACNAHLGSSTSGLADGGGPRTPVLEAECLPGIKQASSASLRWVQGQTLEVLQVTPLEAPEQIASLCAVTFAGDAEELIAVGTAFVHPVEQEPLRGSVLLFRPGTSGGCPFSLAAKLEVEGGVYALAPFQGMLLGTVQNALCLWWLADSAGTLQEVCSRKMAVISLHLQTMGDLILVGDIQREMALLRFKANATEFEEVAFGWNSCPGWLTAMELLNENTFVCADDLYNIWVWERQDAPAAVAPLAQPARGGSREAAMQGKRSSELELAGQMHGGEFVHRLRRAALVEPVASVSGRAGRCSARLSASQEPVIWASVDGAIGVVVPLAGEREFARLSVVQNAVLRQLPKIDCLQHGLWRSVWSETQGHGRGENLAHHGFIDGDVLEQFLRLPPDSQRAVVDDLIAQDVMVDDVDSLVREVEELAWLH